MENKIDTMNQIFEVDYPAWSYEELDIPFCSGLAARLKIYQITTESGKEIPWNVKEQAKLWKEHYTSKPNVEPEEFITVVSANEEGRRFQIYMRMSAIA